MGSLALISGPTAEPITLAEARAQVRVSDAYSDAQLAALMFAAREWAQGYTRRQLVTQTWDYHLHCFPMEIRLPIGPVQSITSIKYYDTSNVQQTLSTAYYQSDLVSVVPRICEAYNYEWPDTYDRYNAVTVRFVAGYGSQAPELHSIRQALLLHIEAHYDRDDRNFDTLMRAAENLLDPLRVF